MQDEGAKVKFLPLRRQVGIGASISRLRRGERLGLVDDVDPDGLAPPGDQPVRHRARLAVTDRTAGDADHRQDREGRAREETLVGGVEVVRLKVLLMGGDAQLPGQFQRQA